MKDGWQNLIKTLVGPISESEILRGWQTRIEFVFNGDVRALDFRRDRSGPADLIFNLSEPAVEALTRADWTTFLAKTDIRGRLSQFHLMANELFAAFGQECPYPRVRMLGKKQYHPTWRRERADALVEELRRAFAPSACERAIAMTRMWTCEEDVPYISGRLSDFAIPDTCDTPWVEASTCRLTQIVEPFVEELRAESRKLAEGRVQSPPAGYDEDMKWDASKPVHWGRYAIVRTGEERPRTIDELPVACAFAAEAMKTGRIFDISYLTMTPGYELPPHWDGSAELVSWHVGLTVPEGAGVLVGDEARSHRERQVLAFNDSFRHSAWNRAPTTRTVLSAWEFSPALRDEEIPAVKAFTTAAGFAN